MKRHKKRKGTLGSGRRWILYSIALGVWLSGGMWLVYHYLLVKQGEFGPTTNPWEPWWLRIHGLFAFGSLWVFGLLWGIHITKLWPGTRKKWSGGFMTGLFLVLIVTGYLLYYVGDDRARRTVSEMHWIVGLASPSLFLWHRFYRKRGAKLGGSPRFEKATPPHSETP